MTKPRTAFRKHFTENHIHAMRVVELLVNATPQSVAFSYGNMTKDGASYWRKYLNDLIIKDFVICKPIVTTGLNRNGVKTGQRCGSLFALTQKGVECLAENTEKPIESLHFPRGGITSGSPLMYPHRASLLDVLGLIIGLEKSLDDFEVLEIFPYFRHENTSTQNKTGFAIGRVEVPQDTGESYKSPVLIPDAVVKIRIGERVRLVVIELHRQTSVQGIIEALRKHAQAIETGLFNQKFNVSGVNFVLSIHTDPDRLKNTVKQIKSGSFPDFDRYLEGFNFATVEELIIKGVSDSLYQLDELKGRIFTSY
jgi:hypothetical protein